MIILSVPSYSRLVKLPNHDKLSIFIRLHLFNPYTCYCASIHNQTLSKVSGFLLLYTYHSIEVIINSNNKFNRRLSNNLHIAKMAPGKALNEAKIQEMKEEFLNLDADGDGTITVEELGKVLRSMMAKLKVSEGDITKVLKDIDQDGDGAIDLKEYFNNMENSTSKNLIHRALVQRSKARKSFEKFDKDGSGFVTTDEVIEVFEEIMGGPVTINQFEDILQECNKNNDGKINYEEFVVLMTKTKK